MTEHDKPLLTYAVEYFESWDSALEAIGLVANEHRVMMPTREWDKEVITQALQTRYGRDLPMTRSALAQDDYALLRAIYRHFGSLHNAFNAAGIKSTSPPISSNASMPQRTS